MRVTGKSVLSSIELRVRSYAADVQRLENAVGEKEKEIAAANKRREDAYLELAGLYADDFENLKRELVAASGAVQAIFDEKAKRRSAVEAEMDRFRELISRSQDDVAKAREGRDEAAAERDACAELVNAELAADAAFQTLRQEHEAAKQKVTVEKTASAELALEVAGKLAAYESHYVFAYLLKQRYGQDEYRGKGLTARIDGWLAKKVDWAKNHPNYAILKELPAYAERRVTEAERAAATLDARGQLRMQECHEKHGLVDRRAKYDRCCLTVAEFEKRRSELEAQLETVSRERSSLQMNQDPYVQRAKQALKATLASEPLRELRARAERTPDPRDDQIVAVIEAAEEAVNRGREEVKALRAQYVEADKQRARAQAARRRFSANYTGTYDRFDSGFDAGSLLHAYILGEIAEDVFWTGVNQSYRKERSQWSSSSGSSWSSDSGGSSWSSSSDSSSSSFGGGDSGGSSFGGGDSGSSSFGGGD